MAFNSHFSQISGTFVFTELPYELLLPWHLTVSSTGHFLSTSGSDDISLQPGDLLTVPMASLRAAAGLDYQEGGERSPKGWLHSTNDRAKRRETFQGLSWSTWRC